MNDTKAVKELLSVLITDAVSVLGHDNKVADGYAERQLWLLVCTSLARRFHPKAESYSALGSWFNAELNVSVEVIDRIASNIRAETSVLREVGIAYEKRLSDQTAIIRKDKGAYFTPIQVAESVVQRMIQPMLLEKNSSKYLPKLTFCDPAAGAGGFAFPLIDYMAAKIHEDGSGLTAVESRTLAFKRSVYLVDVNPLTVAILRSLMWIHMGCSEKTILDVTRQIVVGDALRASRGTRKSPAVTGELSDWEISFPEIFEQGGFSGVIGNPPWGTLRPMISRWNGDRSELWNAYSSGKNSYASILRSDGQYVLQGAGDSEFYRYFIERSLQILKKGGRLGLIVPSAFLRAEGAVLLRQHLLANGSFGSVVEYWNTKRIFDIHPMFRFIMLSWVQGPTEGIKSLSLANTDIQVEDFSSVALSKDYLYKVSGERMSIPDVRTFEEKELLGRLASIHPLLGEVLHDSWNLYFVRELDMTNASERFIRIQLAVEEGAKRNLDNSWTHPRLGKLLPVYEGRMVNQYDAFAKSYVSGTGRSAVWEPLPPSRKSSYPQYLVPVSNYGHFGFNEGFRAGFCDVTGHANERTVLAAVLDANSVAGNKVPTVRFDVNDADLHYLWVAIANSFVIDWIARRRVATSMNYFQWKQIPFPRLDPTSGIGKKLVQMSKRLSHWDLGKSDLMQLESRALLRAKIDALIAKEFDLGLEDMALILQDFPLLDRNAGQERGNQTRDLVLCELARLRGIKNASLIDAKIHSDHGPFRLSERVNEAKQLGRVAYVTGEMRKAIGEFE